MGRRIEFIQIEEIGRKELIVHRVMGGKRGLNRNGTYDRNLSSIDEGIPEL